MLSASDIAQGTLILDGYLPVDASMMRLVLKYTEYEEDADVKQGYQQRMLRKLN